MANIKANIKSIRKNAKRKARNKSEVTACKSKIKKARSTGVVTDLSAAYKKIDSICAKKRVHKNKANRIKSRIAKNANKRLPNVK